MLSLRQMPFKVYTNKDYFYLRKSVWLWKKYRICVVRYGKISIIIAFVLTHLYFILFQTCHGVINKDKHLAIGHFLLGEVQCKKRHYDDAWKSFDAALQLLRGKDTIDYSQLGLAHKLYKCEVCNHTIDTKACLKSKLRDHYKSSPLPTEQCNP